MTKKTYTKLYEPADIIVWKNTKTASETAYFYKKCKLANDRLQLKLNDWKPLTDYHL